MNDGTPLSFAGLVVPRGALVLSERGGSTHAVRANVRHPTDRSFLRLQIQIVEPRGVMHMTCVDPLPRDVCYPRHRAHFSGNPATVLVKRSSVAG